MLAILFAVVRIYGFQYSFWIHRSLFLNTHESIFLCRTLMRQLSTIIKNAFSAVREGGISYLLFRIIKRYEQTWYRPRGLGRIFYIPLFIFLCQLHLLLDERSIAIPNTEEGWQVRKLPFFHPERHLLTLSPVAGTRHGSRRHQQILGDLYSYDGFVTIGPSDVVVDVGAYIGGFSLFAAKRAAAVIAVDPNAILHDVLDENLSAESNTIVVPVAAWNSNTTIKINQSFYPYENSPLPVDLQSTGNCFEVEALTIPRIIQSEGYDHIDFLKIEAEGAELEILDGVFKTDLPVSKIAIDASPERDGHSQVSEIVEKLENHGYETRTKEEADWWGEYIVFARKTEFL